LENQWLKLHIFISFVTHIHLIHLLFLNSALIFSKIGIFFAEQKLKYYIYFVIDVRHLLIYFLIYLVHKIINQLIIFYLFTIWIHITYFIFNIFHYNYIFIQRNLFFFFLPLMRDSKLLLFLFNFCRLWRQSIFRLAINKYFLIVILISLSM